MTSPILFEIPTHIETERLLMRVPQAGDGPTSAEAINESLAELKPWMPWAAEPHSVEQAEEYARRMAARFALREEIVLFIFERDSGRMVGSIGVHNIDWQTPSFEIGYWLRTSETGKGYMGEAVDALTRFAFETLKAERVEIRCDSANEGSAAVARRAGYLQEAHFRNAGRNTSGELADILVFAMIRPDYEARYALRNVATASM